MVHPASPVTSAKPIRIFILDDHELVRRGLVDLLTATSSACSGVPRRRCTEQPCVGRAGNLREAIERRFRISPQQ
jgi:DNA-binding NarL/FixJ family response regulator